MHKLMEVSLPELLFLENRKKNESHEMDCFSHIISAYADL